MESLFKVFIPDNIIDGVKDVLYSGALSSGQYVRKFENDIKNFLRTDNSLISTNTYDSASGIVWEVLGLEAGNEVIASPMSCLASNQPLALKRAKMIWTDIDPLVGSLDPEAVKRNITKNTKAILHYHWGGFPGHIDDILKIGKEYGVPVIEDAIESFGSEYKNKKIGNTGADFTLFSFQPVRLPTTIDGGAIVFKKEEDYQKAKLIRDYGIDRSKFRDSLGEIDSSCDISLPGFGAGMNELAAYIGIKSLVQLPKLIDKQRQNAVKNENYLKRFKEITLLNVNNTRPNYWIHSFLSPNRDTLLNLIRKDKKYASKVHIRNDYYSVFGNFQNDLKGVQKFNEEILSIPSGWWVE